jgi:hypothetical protein
MSPRPTLADMASIPIDVRAKIVRKLCQETRDPEDRIRFFVGAFLTPTSRPAVPTVERSDGQLALDLEAVAS